MVEEYAALLEKYRRMLGMVDAFHFNSQNTAEVYGRYMDIPIASKVIPITHSGILDRRKARCYDERLLRLGFIGSEAPYKGLPILKDVITQLNKDGYSDKITLQVYGGRTGVDENIPNVVYKGRFTSAMMAQVFDDMDILVVPSICFETFSLVTMEALSFGTCVLVSDKVGAKDIVAKYAPRFVFKDKQDLQNLIKELLESRGKLTQYNHSILNSTWPWSMEQHTKEIIERIYK